MFRNRLFQLGSLFVILAFIGCGTQSESDESRALGEIGQQTGAVRLFAESTDPEIVGFKFNVYLEAVEPLSDGAEPMREPFMTMTKLLDDGHFPYGLRDKTGKEHRFADAYFVLPAATYNLEVIPLMQLGDELVKLETCTPGISDGVQVQQSTTTEVFLVANCAVPPTGALDIAVLINKNPTISKLTFAPSKFIRANQTLTILAEASDSDADEITYKWEILSSPSREGYILNQTSEGGNEMTFQAEATGKYEAKVTVCDGEQQCSSLSFPIYVGDSFVQPAAPGEPVVIEPEQPVQEPTQEPEPTDKGTTQEPEQPTDKGAEEPGTNVVQQQPLP